MNQRLFRGTATALVTPFTADDQIDYRSLRTLIELQLSGDIDALVVLGTTGENPTISHDERRRLIDATIAIVDGRVPVIVGTGTNATATSVTFACEAAAAGATGQLVVAPYYNKPTQDGFIAHVSAIADATDLPIILYNVPGRTGLNITPETVVTLANRIPSVAAIKEASGNLGQISDILVNRPTDFAVYSGDDELALAVGLLGGDGCISVISNALPNEFSRLVRNAMDGNVVEARTQHFNLLAAMRSCFAETNPIPIKAVLEQMHVIEARVRLPLTPLGPDAATTVHNAFAPHAYAGTTPTPQHSDRLVAVA